VPLSGHLLLFVCDPSGGQADSTTAAVAHRDGDVAVLDALIEIPAPHNPATAIETIAKTLKSYGIHKTVANKYGSGFAVDAFARSGIRLEHSERDRSQLYLEMLPLFSSGRVRLLDDRRLVSQLAGLERRSFASGRDKVDHGLGGKDDACNAAAGVLVLVSGKRPLVISDAVLERARQPDPSPRILHCRFGRRCRCLG
jgi:hypothetical protein